jgi:hypothetical protein
MVLALRPKRLARKIKRAVTLVIIEDGNHAGSNRTSRRPECLGCHECPASEVRDTSQHPLTRTSEAKGHSQVYDSCRSSI